MEVWKRYNEKELSHSMAHYLQAVAGLKREKGYARVGDIADRLGVSKSGVTSMLRSLQNRGLVDHEKYGCVELTDPGALLAERTESNREVLSVFFREILGVPETVADEDACMIEHLVSAQSMSRLLRLTRVLSSGHDAAAELRTLYQSERKICKDHDVDSCEVCTDHCLGETLLQLPTGEQDQ